MIEKLTDDTLTLYYYDDGLTAAERQSVTEALAADEALAERYRQLVATLSGLSPATKKVPDDMLARFHATIDRAADMESAGRRSTATGVHGWSFFWGVAVTAALAIGIGIGVWLGNTPPAGTAELVAANTPTSAVPAAFTRSMQVHFRDSRRELDAMPVGSDAERIMLILGLIEQNRLFERAAEQNRSPELARVLRAFEPILIRLAAEDISPEDAEALRRQLDFELNVMLTKLERAASDQSHST
jgi:hypothetical protein